VDFALSEEQEELAGLAARILEDRMDLQHLKERDFSEDWYDLDTWREFAKANLLGIALPESAGGLGLGFLDLCMVLREVGRNVAPLPVIPTLVSAAMPIARYGTEAQQAILSKVVAGEVLLTAALVEFGAEPESPTTTAVREGDGWRLDGVKGNVPGAAAAELILVPART
jgi:alkylation response protein AidB-like acyl-CoA dehydrogenase